MKTSETKLSADLASMTGAWIGLVILTVASLNLGQWFHGTAWLQLLVAAIIWIKGILVAKCEFRRKLDSNSKASWTLIPAQPGQPKVIT